MTNFVLLNPMREEEKYTFNFDVLQEYERSSAYIAADEYTLQRGKNNVIVVKSNFNRNLGMPQYGDVFKTYITFERKNNTTFTTEYSTVVTFQDLTINSLNEKIPIQQDNNQLSVKFPESDIVLSFVYGIKYDNFISGIRSIATDIKLTTPWQSKNYSIL